MPRKRQLARCDWPMNCAPGHSFLRSDRANHPANGGGHRLRPKAHRFPISVLRKAVSSTLVLAALVGLAALQTRFYEAKRALAHAIGHTEHHIGNLQSSLEFAAIEQPAVFRTYVGYGLTVDATAIPLRIATNFIGDVRTSQGCAETLMDDWGRPLHLKIAPGQATNGGKDYLYELVIWSDGPNRINEFGKGD